MAMTNVKTEYLCTAHEEVYMYTTKRSMGEVEFEELLKEVKDKR